MQWDNGKACGRCLTAWCVDERCATRHKPVQVMITDLCPECKEGEDPAAPPWALVDANVAAAGPAPSAL